MSIILNKFINGNVYGLNIAVNNNLLYLSAYIQSLNIIDSNLEDKIEPGNLYVLVYTKSGQLQNVYQIATLDTNIVSEPPSFILKFYNNRIFATFSSTSSFVFNKDIELNATTGRTVKLLIEFNTDFTVKSYYFLTSSIFSNNFIYPINFTIINNIMYFTSNYSGELVSVSENIRFNKSPRIGIFYGLWDPNFNNIIIRYIQDDNIAYFAGQIENYKGSIIVTGSFQDRNEQSNNIVGVNNIQSNLLILTLNKSLVVQDNQIISSCNLGKNFISNLAIQVNGNNLVLAGQFVGCFSFSGLNIDSPFFSHFTATYNGTKFTQVKTVNPNLPISSNNLNMVYLGTNGNLISYFWIEAKINGSTIHGSGSSDLYITQGLNKVENTSSVDFSNLVSGSYFLSNRLFNESNTSLSLYKI